MSVADSLSRLAEYEAICNGDWCQVPDDGHFYQNLARLLHDAGRDKALYQLLVGSPDWMRTKSIACHGDGSYLHDLQLAIDSITDFSDAAQILTLTQLYTAQRLVQKRVETYDDNLLALMTRLGHREEALNFAQSRSWDEQQLKGLLAIFEMLDSLGQPTDDVYDKIRNVIMGRSKSYNRAQLLDSLTEVLVRRGHVADLSAVIASFQLDAEGIDKFYVDTAETLFIAGYYKESKYILMEAIRHNSFEANIWRTLVLADLGVVFSQYGQHSDADAVFAKALELAMSFSDYEQADSPGLPLDNPAIPMRTRSIKYVAGALRFAGRSDEADKVLEILPNTNRDSNERKWNSIFFDGITEPNVKPAETLSVQEMEQTLLAARKGADQLDEGEAQIKAMKEIRRHFNMPVPEIDLAIVPDEPERDLPYRIQPETQGSPSISKVVEYMRDRYYESSFIAFFAIRSEYFEALEPGLSRSILCQACRIAGWFSPNWKVLYEKLPCNPAEV